MFFQTYDGRVHAVAETERRYEFGWTRCRLYTDSSRSTRTPGQPFCGYVEGRPVNCLACLAKEG